jgi:hypothetical protein
MFPLSRPRVLFFSHDYHLYCLKLLFKRPAVDGLLQKFHSCPLRLLVNFNFHSILNIVYEYISQNPIPSDLLNANNWWWLYFDVRRSNQCQNVPEDMGPIVTKRERNAKLKHFFTYQPTSCGTRWLEPGLLA